VPDQAYEAARAVFDERELVDLTIAVSLMTPTTAWPLASETRRKRHWRSSKEILMKIFVTGATGTVGLPLVRAPGTLGHRVTGWRVPSRAWIVYASWDRSL
jgi:hypothetical protein